MTQNFIKTADQDTAEKLLMSGFQLVSHDGNMYTFLNQPPTNFLFEEVDKKKFVYSNILNV